MKNVLVTGASGFVGKSLLPLLRKNGKIVRAACRSELSIEAIDNEANYDWRCFDLRDENVDYDNLLEDIDVVIHLAAQVHIMGKLSKEEQGSFQEINTRGTENLAIEAAKRGVKRFIFLSTIKVNGEGSGKRMLNATDIPAPQDPYAISKRNAEQALKNAAKGMGMDYVILRPPLVYGPGVRANFLRLLSVVSRKIPLPFAAIDNLRSMIYVENLADILWNCIDAQNAGNKIYLVKDIDISTPGLVRAIANAFQRQAVLFPVPIILLKIAGFITGRQTTIDRLTDSLLVDDSPLRNDLGWAPPYNLDAALKTTVDWYHSNPGK